MVDSDLAELYNVKIKAPKEAVQPADLQWIVLG